MCRLDTLPATRSKLRKSTRYRRAVWIAIGGERTRPGDPFALSPYHETKHTYSFALHRVYYIRGLNYHPCERYTGDG